MFAQAAAHEWSRSNADFSVVFMGYGSDSAQLTEIARQWPSRLILLPPQSEEVAAVAFTQAVGGLASINAHPRLAHAVPVKALASIVTGCPLLFVGEGSFAKEVETHSYGVACARDVVQIGNAMRRLALAPWSADERRALSDRATRQFDNRVLARDLVTSIEKLVSIDATIPEL